MKVKSKLFYDGGLILETQGSGDALCFQLEYRLLMNFMGNYAKGFPDMSTTWTRGQIIPAAPKIVPLPDPEYVPALSLENPFKDWKLEEIQQLSDDHNEVSINVKMGAVTLKAFREMCFFADFPIRF